MIRDVKLNIRRLLLMSQRTLPKFVAVKLGVSKFLTVSHTLAIYNTNVREMIDNLGYPGVWPPQTCRAFCNSGDRSRRLLSFMPVSVLVWELHV